MDIGIDTVQPEMERIDQEPERELKLNSSHK
jgi:hypothetical protein